MNGYDGPDAVRRVVGVGHPVIDEALLQATSWPDSAAVIPADLLANPIAVCRITDRVTATGAQVRSALLGFEEGPNETVQVLADWSLLRKLNGLTSR